MAGDAGEMGHQADELRRLIPFFALVVTVITGVAQRPSAPYLLLSAVPVVAFWVWAYVPKVPLPALAVAVIVPVVVAQRSGQLEPLLFDVALFAFVAGRWSPSLKTAAPLGVLAAACPVVVGQIDPAKIGVGIWVLGMAFPWAIGRFLVRQADLAAQLDATRHELAQQMLLSERRRIARDVHDLVGHGLAAVMLQVTSARHVLHRDPAAAEDALRSAEEVGRRSMQELRRTVALLRSDDESGVAPPLPSAQEIPALVEHARAGGLAVELRTLGDLAQVPEGVGVALYRISQEALANAARHAPRACTVLELELAGVQAVLTAETTGPVATPAGVDGERRYGLLGMRERATALGGDFDAGPTPHGWRVRCRIPLAARGELISGDVQTS